MNTDLSRPNGAAISPPRMRPLPRGSPLIAEPLRGETSVFISGSLLAPIIAKPAHHTWSKIGLPLAARENPALFFPVSSSSELPGLTACLDRLCYHHGGASLPPDKPHAFVYFITIRNGSDRAVTLLGRKWVVVHGDGTRLVIEGDKIVGETPHLAPGEQFSYNSYHVTGMDACAHGSFHGVDELGNKVHVMLPPFEMNIPRE